MANFPNSPATGDSTTIAGVTYVYDGSAWKAAIGVGNVLAVQVFTADGTYTPTTGMEYCIVEAVGGGGAGGSTAQAAAGSWAIASGGGSGGYSKSLFPASTIGTSKAVDIGTGGAQAAAGDNDGGAGADTTLGTTLVVAKGGGGGKGNSGVATGDDGPGAGGVAGTGNILAIPGASGWAGGFWSVVNTQNSGVTGHGGSSHYGAGGKSNFASNGSNGSIYGGGGGGGGDYNAGGGKQGGNGAAGVMIITEYTRSSPTPGVSSSTDNTVPRFNGTAGLLQPSSVYIDDSDRIVTGHSAAIGCQSYVDFDVTPLIQSHSTQSQNAFFTRYSNNVFGAHIALGHSRSTSFASHTVVQNGDDLGAISFQGDDGTEFKLAAVILGECDGTPGTDDMPGALHFQTTPDGSNTPQTKLSIHSDGGIRFPASQLASSNANTLDDYEKGTFSPTLTTTGTDFTSVTYDSVLDGTYTKIGRAVLVSITMKTDSVTVGSATGGVSIGNLPFTSTGSSVQFTPLSVGYCANWAGEEPLHGMVVGSSVVANLYYRAAVDGNAAQTAVADVGTGANANEIYLAGNYNT